MNKHALNDILEQFLSQLHQWKSQLAITTIEPTKLESIMLDLHNSLDLINAYDVKDFDRSHLPVIKEIDKGLKKISALVELLSGDINAVLPAKIEAKFKLYGQFGK